MHFLHDSRKLILLTIVCLVSAMPVLAEPIANVYISEEVIKWSPNNDDYERLDLTVSGPRKVYMERGFRPAETPHVGLYDQYGKALPDGSYSWELRLLPYVDESTRDLLDTARARGDCSIIEVLRDEGRLPQVEDTVQHGYFTVLEGLFVADQRPEPKAPLTTKAAPQRDSGLPPLKDFVINDDLIVDGSACIGFDCVNGESFGFDTIRLKENNLRIKFDDTSTAASFPSTDWQLTANASANGGASKFSIDDISGSRTPFTVEANARSHSLYVDDGGRIGNRTSTPSTEIHTIDGDTPTLRLQQDGSSGFAPQTWDVAGNETNFFIRDVSNGSQLPLRIRPGAPTSSIFVDVDGDVGFGTASPDADLHIFDTGADNLDLDLEANGQIWRWRVNNATGQMNFINSTAGTTVVRVDTAATANLLEIGVNGNNEITVDGDIVATGSITPDYVFEDDYELESIEEHAAYMWANKHLPAVGGATIRENGKHVVNLAKRAQGALEELEKAHIYIEQLHNAIQGMQSRFDDMQRQIEELKAD